MTPEARVKKLVREYLSELHTGASGIGVYYEMPVPTGYGKSGLDFTVCLWGHFIAIETKAPDRELTPRQRQRSMEILAAGGAVFVISGPEGLEAFKRWVERCREDIANIAAS